MKQYEVWWAMLPAPAYRRPVLLLTRSGGYAYLNKVAVAEVTTTIRSIPVEVPLGRDEGLPIPSVANLDNLRTIPTDALLQKIGMLSKSRHRAVKRALGYALEWDELMRL